MTLLSKLVTKLTLQSGEYEKGMQGATATAQKFGKATGEVVKTGTDKASAGIVNMGGVVKGLVGAGLFLKAGQMALDFANQSVQAASEAEQGYGKFQSVFKSSADSVETELVEMANDIRRSKYDLMGYASTLQDTFVPLGFARDKAAEFSVELVGLAEDLASFNDLPTADVVRDIQSALVGNTETMRKYGVVAQETQIKAKAFELGLWDGTGAIDAQTKALTIYEIILAGTTDAHGTAAKEAETYDSATRGLEAATLDLKVALGNELLPAMTEAKQASAEWVSSLAFAVDAEAQIKAAAEAGIITRSNATALINEATWTNYSFAEALEWVSHQEDLHNQALEESARVAASADLVFQNYTETLEENEAGVSSAKEAQAQLKQELKDLQLYIKGPLGAEIEDYTAKNEELTLKVYSLNYQIGQLEKQEYLTAEQKTELAGLRTELEETTGEIEAHAEAHAEATKSILFDLIQQRAAVDGLSEAELTFLNDIALEWGLVDEATHEAVKSIDPAMHNLATGNNDEAVQAIEDLRREAEDTEGDYRIHFNISSSGKITVPDVGGGPGTGFTPYSGGLAYDFEELVGGFDLAQAVAGSMSGFGKLFAAETVDPLEERFDSLTTGFESQWDDMLDYLEGVGYDLAEFTSMQDIMKFIHDQTFAGEARDVEGFGRAQALRDVYIDRLNIQRELNAEAERYEEIQEQERTMDFLNEQIELISLIEEAGLDAQEILGGIQLGLGAEEGDLMEAMSRYLNAMVADTDAMLQAWNLETYPTIPGVPVPRSPEVTPIPGWEQDITPIIDGGYPVAQITGGIHLYGVEDTEALLAELSELWVA